MQAVDQMVDAIRYRRVTNLKGDLPPGYVNAGSRTVPGVGKMSRDTISRAVEDHASLAEARQRAEAMAAIWAALSSVTDPALRESLIERHGADLVRNFNHYASLMRRLGLEGPCV